MTIIDCTLGFNELDLFMIRYHELKDVVDRFLIVEATHTHSGKPKPAYFTDWVTGNTTHNGITFGDTFDADRVDVALWDNAFGGDTSNAAAWHRENMHRELIGQILTQHYRPTDIALLSDMDEIPSGKTLARFLNPNSEFSGIWLLEQDLTYLYFNTYAGKWCGTRIFYVEELYGHMPVTNRIRYGKEIAGTITNGGWHFSSCGGLDKVRYKFDSYAHTEMQLKTNDDIANSLRRVVDPFNHNPLEIRTEDFLPDYVKQNREYFRNYIYTGNS